MKEATRIIFSLVVLSSVWIAEAVDLANSSYPINGANPQRNNHINRPILCSSISKGRTTVLNIDQSFADESAFFPYWITPVLDDQNFLYITAKLASYALRKINLSNLVIEQTITSIDQGLTTIGTTKVFSSSVGTTEIFQRSNLASLSQLINSGGDNYASLVPYLSDLMIRAQTGISADSPLQSFIFLNASSGEFQNSPIAPSIGSPREAMVYKSTTTEYPIFVGEFQDGAFIPNIMISAGEGRFFRNISNTGLHTNNPFIVDNTVYIFTSQNTIHHVSVLDGTTTRVQSWDLYGNCNLNKNVMIKGTKVLASLEVTDLEMFVIAELNQNVTVRSDEQFAGNPVFSLVDNVVLMSVLEASGNVKLLGLDWDNWGVKVVGNLGILGNGITSEPVIGEDCNVHIIADGALHTLKPLPLQQVVPVIECIDDDNTAYFSYNNLETRPFEIPFVSDRNNLIPMDQAPETLFQVGSGDHFPLGPSLTLVPNQSNSYKWILEEYVLEFANTPALRCPTNVSLFLRFTATAPFDIPSFSTIVRNAFLNVTGIRDTRLSPIKVAAMAVRSVYQGDSSLELELQILPGNQSEPSAPQVVTDFVTNQQNEFNNQVSGDPNAPSGTTLTDVSTKQPETAQSGVIVQAPTSQPSEPAATVPNSVPSAVPSSMSQTATINFLFFIASMLSCLFSS